MKKCLFGALAAVAALFTTSCAKDAQVAEVTLADATVTFGVTAPELGSRADADFGNGKSAQKLTVLVYDKNGYRSDLQVEQSMGGGLTTTVEVKKLIKGETYSFLFWAQADAAECFTLDAANGKVAIDYAKAMNNENVDAFFAQELDLRVDNALNKTVTLKRPFAQINLGTDDMDAVKKQFGDNAFANAKSTLTVKNIYNTLDLHDGSVAGIGEVTIPAAKLPEGTFSVGTVPYNYLALNYVLVEADKALVDVDYTINGIDGVTDAKTVSLTGVPVQRNYRTNLYGSLFTTSASFNVEIVPGFVDDYNNGTSTFDMEGVEKVGVNEYNILNAKGLVNASSQLFAKGGTFNITPDGTRAEGDTDVIDMTGVEYTAPNLNALGKVELVINGNNKTIKGLKDMLLERPFLKTLVIKDLTLDGTTIANTETGYKCYGAFIGDKTNLFETNGNIEFDNCHVVNANISTAAKYCAGFLPYYSNHGENSKTVINNCSVKNSTFKGEGTSIGAFVGHAVSEVSMDGIVAENNVITNTEDNKAGVIIGTVNACNVYVDNYTANDNKINGTNYRGEEKLYGRNVDGKFFLNGGEVTAIETLFSNEENIYVKLTEEKTALNANNAYLALGGADTKTITIEGATGKEVFFLPTTYWSRISTVNPDAVLTFKNCVLDSGQAEGTWNSYDVTLWKTNVVLEDVVANKALAFDGSNATLKNVTINELAHDYYALWITATCATVKMENCNINTIGRAIKISDQYVDAADRKVVALEINGGKFVSNSKPAIYVGNTAGANVTVKNLDITGVKTGVMITRDTDAAYKDAPIYYNGKFMYSATVNGKQYSSVSAALADAEEGATINIAEDATIIESLNDVKNATLVGAEDGSSVLDITAYNPTRWDGVTIKNMTISSNNNNYTGFQHAGEIKFVNCTLTGLSFGYGSHEVYENCTFEQSKSEYNMWTYGGNIDYIGCTFKGKGKFLNVYNEGNGGVKTTINVKNCKFISTSYGKCAINIKTKPSLHFDVNIDNCTVEGKFPSTNGGLWQIETAYDGTQDVSVKVDGVEVYQK